MIEVVAVVFVAALIMFLLRGWSGLFAVFATVAFCAMLIKYMKGEDI